MLTVLHYGAVEDVAYQTEKERIYQRLPFLQPT